MNDLTLGSQCGDEIIERLNNAGFEAYYVGGCVRNAILGIKINDFDIASSAKPTEVIKLFKDYKLIETGLKHGTVTVIADMPYEITTFRKEGKYSDSRHPDKVYFCRSITDDLARRDFTCNAIAYSKNKGFIDIFGGFYDTRNHILRAVGVPSTRFKEDVLRILRGLRFASEFGFNIDDRTSRAMINNKSLLDNISRERIYSELKKIVSGQYFYPAVIDYFDIINQCFNNELDPKKYLQAVTSTYKCNGDFNIKLTVFLYIEYNKNLSSIMEILSILRSDNNLKKTVTQCISCMQLLSKNIDCFYQSNSDDLVRKYVAKKILNMCCGSYKNFLFFVHSLDIPQFSFDIFKNSISEVFAKNECYSINQLDINGTDVMNEGFSGHKISDTLNIVLDSVMRGQTTNEKKYLLEYIKNLKKS